MAEEPGERGPWGCTEQDILNDWHTHTQAHGLCPQRAYHQEIKFGGFPIDPVVEKPPANAGNTDLILAAGRSHLRRATKPLYLNYCTPPPGRRAHVLQQKNRHNEKLTVTNESIAPTHCNWRQPFCSSEDLCAAKNK